MSNSKREDKEEDMVITTKTTKENNVLRNTSYGNLQVEARASSTLEIEIEAKLNQFNKPAVKSIKSGDGDMIDCVDIYKQPGFDHPSLKNHKIQMIPDSLLKHQISNTIDASQSNSENVFQTWQRSGTCPKGTIPIRRILKEDFLRAASFDRFGMKPPAIFKNSTNPYNLFSPNLKTSNVIVPENRSAAYLVTMGYNYIGAEADINVWNPNVDLPDDFTTAQIWLKAGSDVGFESVEAGWMVNPKLYGDKATRLFASWTKDSYVSTGCFDLTCPGFIQVNPDVALGAALEPVSSQSGDQYDINVGMFWDADGNWWLLLKHDIVVGYWPSKVLGSLRHSAILVEWGGQVFSSNLLKTTPHTRTAMGSGEHASSQLGVSCYMGRVRIKDYSRTLKYPEFVYPIAEEPYCYNALNDVKYGVEPVFYFGGPGQSPPYCP
ncbi:protein neprosin-like [Gastrolobium bilobum]|uniref:protein neprosin-like n=1 Tax=Gastrolobium bilobum TaxID=150636 RepID=UPI002AB27A62|nr:protein neprosin-like [Gastrolobium bilobum]